jgi:hypothetical protein
MHRSSVQRQVSAVAEGRRLDAEVGRSIHSSLAQSPLAEESVYVLVAIIRKRLNLPLSLYSMLQILSVTPFEKAALIPLFTGSALFGDQASDANQLNLF